DDVLLGFNQVRCAFSLCSHLDYPAVLSGRGYHSFSFHDIDADGLLDIYVRAGLQRVNGLKGVPMVGGADEYNVQLVFFKKLSIVSVQARQLFCFQPFRYHTGGLVQQISVDITQGNDFHGGDLDESEEIALSIPSSTN